MDTVGEFDRAVGEPRFPSPTVSMLAKLRLIGRLREFANSISRVAGTYCYVPAPSELDVRVALPPAQAFTNAPRGTRPLPSVVPARGPAGGNWHASTPYCPPCPYRLGCARSDGGSGNLGVWQRFATKWAIRSRTCDST